MVQPWDFWHVQGASGVSMLNTRDTGNYAGGVVGSPAYMTRNMLTAKPFFVGDNGIKLSAVGVCLPDLVQPGSLRIGVYRCPPPSAHVVYPTQLVQDFGALTLAGSRTPSLAISPALELEPGFHFIATLPSTVVARCQPVAVNNSPNPIGFSRRTNAMLLGFTAYQPFGALPATFPALATKSYGIWFRAGQAECAYFETNGLSSSTITMSYNGALGANTATVVTDNTTTVTAQYGPNTLVSTVVAALDLATNITVATLIADATLPNGGAYGLTTQNQGPLEAVQASNDRYMPLVGMNVSV